jgi:hypothetical protein
MSKLVWIVGLPGSGKTYYAERHPIKGAKFFDDPSANAASLDELKRHIQAGGNAVITDVYSVSTTVRALAESKLRAWGVTEIEWMYFENDPEACIRNIGRRRDGRLVSESYVREAAKHYAIPEGVEILPVFQG